MSGSLQPADVCDVCFHKHGGVFVTAFRSWNHDYLVTLCRPCYQQIIRSASLQLADKYGGEVVRSLQ